MPRERRKKSCNDVYHIVSKGNSKIYILQSDIDKRRYLSLMKNKKDKYGVKIYAYCIMSNHVHILLKSGYESLPLYMKEVNQEYAVYYNVKYDKKGHVFQSRYYSSCVENEEYLLCCIRYIHNNPVKASLVKSITDYPFSSAREIILPNKNQSKRCISDESFQIIESRFEDIEKFRDSHDYFDNHSFLDIREEQEAYDLERIRNLAGHYVVDKNLESVNIIFKVPHIKERFIRQSAEQTKLPRLKIENILKTVEKSTCPLLSNSSDNN